jgi:membrane peptidoglycan carboxypeptidase
LGGGEVTLLDITSAYGVFANEGIRNPAVGILRIEDSAGNVIEEYQQNETRVLDQQIAFQISDILSDNEARTPAFGANSPLYFPGRDVAAKTGTTNDSRDAWIVGYAPNIAVGAWAGNNDNSPMVKEVAGFIVAPMWNTFMWEALATFPEETFQEPLPDPNYDDLKPILRGIWQGGETYTIDTITGKLATEHTPPELREERAIPNVHSILYWVDRSNPNGPAPEHPEQDGQYIYWERGVQIWKTQNNITDAQGVGIPSEEDDVHQPQFAPDVTILSPGEDSSYAASERILVTLRTQGRFSRTSAEYFVDGRFIGSANAPFSFSFVPNALGLSRGVHTLRVVVYDEVHNQGSAETNFEIR